MLHFGYPLAFYGLAAVPMLVVIYLLVGKSRVRIVSGLFLWAQQQPSPASGRRMRRLSTPFEFFLELLILLLLLVAAARPSLLLDNKKIPLVAVLDNSYSMLAGGDRSARNQAVEALITLAETGRYAPLHVILAGNECHLLAADQQRPVPLRERLASWTCRETRANIDMAIARARELGGVTGLIWLATDHAPEERIENGDVRWQAFGEARANIAFVNAARGGESGTGWCMVEIANLTDAPQATSLRLTAQSEKATSLQLAAREVRRLVFNLPDSPAPITMSLPEDALNLDNCINLVRADRVSIRVALAIADEPLKQYVEQALTAVDNALITAREPHILITDGASPSDVWTLRILAEGQVSSFIGPYVINHHHPLSEGISLGGVVWSAPELVDAGALPIWSAGNRALLLDLQAGNRHHLEMRFDHRVSTFQNGPNWPIFFWNLCRWRADNLPGLSDTNIRLGATARYLLPQGEEPVIVQHPDGHTDHFDPPGKELLLNGEDVGIYQVQKGTATSYFAVNALDIHESDTSSATSGSWGKWLDPGQIAKGYRDMTWLALLAALALFALHWWWLHHGSVGQA